MQSGIARASYMNEQSESLAGILSGSYAAIFQDDMHGEEHTDEIGVGIPAHRQAARRALKRLAGDVILRGDAEGQPAVGEDLGRRRDPRVDLAVATEAVPGAGGGSVFRTERAPRGERYELVRAVVNVLDAAARVPVDGDAGETWV